MIKCFLSHSSQDKKSYVELVAAKVGIASCVYDKYTFEEGMRSLDEILKGLNDSDLFVLFISNLALESKWVKKEIIEARKRLNQGDIQRIFPIIIDEKIKYSDKRIPDWMRNEYNLKLVSRPVKAASRIRQRLLEISWSIHPNLKQRKKIFVGRNQLISSFEERLDDFEKLKPSTIIATGVPTIGRRSLMEHCLVKSNIRDESYQPSYIYLDNHQSVEDFILKIYDLGFSEDLDLTNLLNRSVKEKIEIALNIVSDLQSAKEIVFIIDNGCIATYDRRISEWFAEIIEAIEKFEILTFCLVSRFQPKEFLVRKIPGLFVFDVKEMSSKERNGLLWRYSEFEGLRLSKGELEFFSGLLTGYPEQVFFTVDQIKSEGLPWAKRNTYIIVEYNNVKAQQLLAKWEDDSEEMHFLRLLSEFEFISYDLVLDIVGDDPFYKEALNGFMALSVVELIGSNREYIRVIENVRDYLKRQKFRLKSEYEEKLRLHVDSFLQTYQNEDKDISDFLYSLKESLKTGRSVDSRYLIPSHFLKTIRELYDTEKQYSEVINLADRILESNQYIDHNILRNVRYYLCLALARKRDNRCLREVQAFKGAEHYFLLGFYYRLKGRYKEAIEKLDAAINEYAAFSRAKKEMVLVLQSVGATEKAFELAKQNYEEDKTNPFQIQGYLKCLLDDIRNKDDNKETIENLLENLRVIQSETAKEMFLTMSAAYCAFHKNDQAAAMNFVSDGKAAHPKIVYPKLMEFDICKHFRDIEGMKIALDEIQSFVGSSSAFFHNSIRRKCIYIAATKGADKSFYLVKQHMSNYPEYAIEKFKKLLMNTEEEFRL